jgi:2-aminoadipate transaminase
MTASAPAFDFGPLLRKDLGPPAVKYTGFPKYNFVGGHNDPDSTPVEGLIEAATNVLEREGRTLATYGLESGPQGYRPLREFLVAKLARYGGIKTSIDEILITSGSLQGLDLVNQVLLEPGDTVLVEEDNYGGALTRLKRLGAKMIAVPLDRGGMRMDAASAALDDLKRRGSRAKYIYTIPTVQNPTGSIMDGARRAELIALAARHGVPILEDECYSDLIWSGQRPRAIKAMAASNSVIHIGSFSKSIAPALRTGYVVASWDILSRLIAAKTDAGSAALEQMVLAEYCAKHFERHVSALNKVLKGKLDALIEAVSEHFGTTAEFEAPPGGIFLWLKLPDEVDTTVLTQKALAAGVAINPGVEWSVTPERGKRRLRICFANPSKAQLREGVGVLAEVCRKEFGVPARIANVARR